MSTLELDPELDHALAVIEKAGLLAIAPRRSPTERAIEAIEQMGHDLISLQDALRAGAEIPAEKRRNLVSFVSMLTRLGVANG